MGVDTTGTQKLMFVGVDTDGKDLIDANHLIYAVNRQQKVDWFSSKLRECFQKLLTLK